MIYQICSLASYGREINPNVRLKLILQKVRHRHRDRVSSIRAEPSAARTGGPSVQITVPENVPLTRLVGSHRDGTEVPMSLGLESSHTGMRSASSSTRC